MVGDPLLSPEERADRGYTKKYPIERILRDVRASRLTAGSTEMMRLIFERLRDPAFHSEFVGDELRGSPVQRPDA